MGVDKCQLPGQKHKTRSTLLNWFCNLKRPREPLNPSQPRKVRPQVVKPGVSGKPPQSLPKQAGQRSPSIHLGAGWERVQLGEGPTTGPNVLQCTQSSHGTEFMGIVSPVYRDRPFSGASLRSLRPLHLYVLTVHVALRGSIFFGDR